MPNLYEAEVQKAQAEVEFADIEYQNTKALTDNKVVAPNELAMAKAKYNKAKADLDLMKTHLDLTLIKAPFDGILNKFQVRLGSFIEEGPNAFSSDPNITVQLWQGTAGICWSPHVIVVLLSTDSLPIVTVICHIFEGPIV